MTPFSALVACSSCLLISSVNAIIDGPNRTKASLASLRGVVSLRLPTEPEKHIGAGSIYAKGWWIITVRSLLIDRETKRPHSILTYPAYSTHLNDLTGHQGYMSDKLFCHPHINNVPEQATNIGLIKLRKPIPMSMDIFEDGFKGLKLIREDFDFANWTEKNVIWVSGWGRYDRKVPQIANESYYTRMSIDFDGEGCTKKSHFMKPYHVCLTPKNRSITTCNGDEGGPAIFFPKTRYYDQFGIIAPPPDEKCMWTPYVINVRYFREFIDNVVRDEPPALECRNLVI